MKSNINSKESISYISVNKRKTKHKKKVLQRSIENNKSILVLNKNIKIELKDINEKEEIDSKEKSINVKDKKIEDENIINVKLNNEKHKKISKELKIILIILAVVMLVSVIICATIFATMNKKIKTEGDFDSSNFMINTKINSLSQISMKSSQIHNSISNNINSSLSIYTKAKFDLFTFNESLPLNKSELYSKIYTTAIIINSQCIEFEEDKKNCEQEKYLDLTIKNQNNIRRNNEDIEEIKEAILPICIIEHSDTNFIFSATCPETLSENLKNNIISAFQSIKLNLCKENYQNYKLTGIKINNTKNHVDINIIDKRCDGSEENENQACEIIRNITTDISGNLQKSIKISKYQKFKKEHNKNDIVDTARRSDRHAGDGMRDAGKRDITLAV